MADVNVTSITYGGKEIKSLEAGKTGTVRCKGKKMKTDLVVKAANIAAAKLQEKTLTANGVYPPDSGYDGFSKVTVDVAGKVLPKYDGEVIIEGEPESSGGGGGSAEFNIAYGDTPPEDTTKLWVKANEPEAVSITSSIVTASEELENSVGTLPSTAKKNMSAAAVGTKIYVFGGYGSNGGGSNAIHLFDTENNTRSTLSAVLPKNLLDVGAAAVGTKIYVFGGYGNSTYYNTIYKYDTESDAVTSTGATVATKAYDIAAVTVGTKIYLFGGCYGSGSSYLSAIQMYDTESNSRSTISAYLSAAATKIGAAAVGTKIYLFGGLSGTGKLNTIQVFDTETNDIETLSTTLPTAAEGIAAAAVGTKIYLFGGYDDSGYLKTIQVFDTESNTIETLSTTLPTATHDIAAVTVGAKIYLLGGGDLTTINAFKALMPLASNNLLVEASATKNRFNLLPNVELGVNNVYLGNADGNGERVDAYLHNGTEWVEV